MGGPHTPAVGWACGIERLAMLLEAPAARGIDAAIVPLGETSGSRSGAPHRAICAAPASPPTWPFAAT